MSALNACEPLDGIAVTRSNWVAIFSLTFGIFCIIAAEFLPVSLITPMAYDLNVSASLIGQSITVTAIVAAISGPIVIIFSSRVDRRNLMVCLSGLLVVSSFITYVSSSIAMLFLPEQS